MSNWNDLVAGRYRLRVPLGGGGMGRLWLARDETLRRDVAVKELVLPAGLSPKEFDELRLRMLREARAAARLSHPNIVQVYDVIRAEGQPWIVMEYVRSRSLHQVLQEDGPLPPARVATIGLALLAALRAAHAAGILHRDVKPGNVLLAEDGRVVLTDFGLAIFDTGEGELTRPGLVLGSPQYVAPERARDGVSTVETDLWSLGATLYAAVEGHAPYARSTAMATLTALATEAVRPPQRAAALRPVLNGLLRKNPRHRLDPEEAERLLRRVATGELGVRQYLVPRPRTPASLDFAGPRSDPGPARSLPADRAAAPPRRTSPEPRCRRPWLIASVVLATVLVPAVLLVGPYLVAEGGSTGRGELSLDVPSAVLRAPRAEPFACGQPQPPPPSPPPSTTGPRARALPDNWRWYDDPSGFSVAVPDGWRYSRSGRMICFREPGRERVLAIEVWSTLDDDPVQYWHERERRLLAEERVPGYQRVQVAPRDLFVRGADWEYTYDGDGARMHGLARGFVVAPGRGYAIHWLCRDFDWQTDLDMVHLITPSFTVAAPLSPS